MKLKLNLKINTAQVQINLGLWCNRITRKLGNDIVMRLQGANPVDTGYSRGRWNFIEPSKLFGAGRIVNDAAYIIFLNQGSSKQAAPGWIDACFYEAVRFLR